MLHAKQYDHAVAALHRVLELAPKMPEAHVNMGFALLGQERGDAARGFFLAAIELRPQQANAYYGLAMAEEMRSDYESALGGMRSYLHLSKADDPHREKARAAIWEWEAKLGRHRKG
nr:tetratricopeptide repeat protein [Ramlibacter albus]